MTTDEEDTAILATLGLCSALLAMVGATDQQHAHIATLKQRVRARQEVRRAAAQLGIPPAQLGIPPALGRRPETWRQN